MITNPDAPRNDHFLTVSIDDEQVMAVPILYSKTEKYDPTRRGGIFQYLRFRLMIVRPDDKGLMHAKLMDGAPRLVEPNDVTGFFEQVGRNTTYIIHPEEILAEHFAILFGTDSQDVPTPKVLEKIRLVLAGK